MTAISSLNKFVSHTFSFLAKRIYMYNFMLQFNNHIPVRASDNDLCSLANVIQCSRSMSFGWRIDMTENYDCCICEVTFFNFTTVTLLESDGGTAVEFSICLAVSWLWSMISVSLVSVRQIVNNLDWNFLKLS